MVVLVEGGYFKDLGLSICQGFFYTTCTRSWILTWPGALPYHVPGHYRLVGHVFIWWGCPSPLVRVEHSEAIPRVRM